MYTGVGGVEARPSPWNSNGCINIEGWIYDREENSIQLNLSDVLISPGGQPGTGACDEVNILAFGQGTDSSGFVEVLGSSKDITLDTTGLHPNRNGYARITINLLGVAWGGRPPEGNAPVGVLGFGMTVRALDPDYAYSGLTKHTRLPLAFIPGREDL